MTDLAHQIQSTLSGRVEGKPRLDQATDVKSMVLQVLEEQRKKTRAQKLTWGPGDEVLTEDENDRVGLYNKRMAAIKIGPCIIQNRRVLYTNGREFPKLADGQYDFSELDDAPQVWRDEIRGQAIGPVRKQHSVRKLVIDAYVRHCATAIEKDPMVCPIAADYRATDERDKMRHFRSVHPVEFAEYIGLDLEPAPGKVDLPAAPLAQNFDITTAEPTPAEAPAHFCCDTQYDARTIKLHQRSKAHQASAATG